MKHIILKDEYDHLKKLIEDEVSWIEIIKFVKKITGTELLREAKKLVDKYMLYEDGKRVNPNLLSEFEIAEDDIAILRIVVSREIRNLDNEWGKLRDQFNSIKTLFEVRFNSLLDEIQEQRNKIEGEYREKITKKNWD